MPKISAVQYLDDSSDNEEENNESSSYSTSASAVDSSVNSSAAAIQSSHDGLLRSEKKEESEGSDPDSIDSTVEMPETDPEDDSGVNTHVKRKTKINRIEDDDESSDEEVQTSRKSFYEVESDDEDNAIEEKAFSKATRRSIDPRHVRPLINPKSDSDDSDSDVILATDDEEEKIQSRKTFENRKPLQDMNNRRTTHIYERFNNSISSKMSSTLSQQKELLFDDDDDDAQDVKPTVKKENISIDSSDEVKEIIPEPSPVVNIESSSEDVKIVKRRVSRSEYSSHVANKEKLEKEVQNIVVLMSNAPHLPDKGEKLKLRLNKLLEQIDNEKMLLDQLEIDENESVKSRIAKSFESPENSAVSVHDNKDPSIELIQDVVQVQPKYTGRVGLQNFEIQKALTVERLETIQQSIDSRPLETQWEHEVKTKVRRGALELNVFHGNNRITRARELSKFDAVVTTYQVAASEFKNQGVLFNIKWNRIVLDEGHIIRNHKSKQSEAVCSIPGKYRWVLSGTPIQNREFDLYAAIKFLKCSPFDDLLYWKRWIEVNKGKDSSPRVQALLKSIMLRRTKQQLMESGEIASLPNKTFQQINVNMNREERFVYNKLMSFSRNIFANYVEQRQQRNDNFTYDQNRLGKLHKKFAQKFNVDREIQAHEILTLLLRLRQTCCHPGLIKQMLQKGEVDVEVAGGDVAGSDYKQDDSDADLLEELEKLNLEDDEVDNGNRFTLENEVFNLHNASSKMIKVMEILRENVLGTDHKAIIVSQWTSYLSLIRDLLQKDGVSYCELNGTIPVKFRNDIVVDFNLKTSRTKVMLLSLTAGGVGLNLVGANFLFLLDLHWNPQLEQQAQDRIYRFGQLKDITVFKFVTTDSIEEMILNLQKKKLEIATSSLTGAKKSDGSKLTMDDLKMLFYGQTE
ncbi:CLUMA_CG010821, isoform A [Clunio marinus]|uniref:CLUMA_CG010821, isoform A n=1 Tax=Clunio marinus TaxID=568069 RepID=A0A1J1IB18_9DIPT|nr:CLUMA_CG010821, isoform A [Clunio marinus]